MRRVALLPAVFIILTILSSGSATAQAGFTLKGTVVDTTGAPIVGARVAGAESRTLTLQIAGFRDTVNVAARPRYVAPAVTSATKTLTPLRDVPQSVTVITKQLIADQSMQSIGDTIRYVPGVSVRRKNRSTTSRSS